MAPTLYTIGHSNHAIETFVGLLRAAGIRRLADVRSIPYSRRSPQFRREAQRSFIYRPTTITRSR